MSTQALTALNLVDFNWVTSLDNVWTDGAPIAPDHNQEAYNAIYGQLKDLSRTKQTASPLGRIIIGEGGSGKTYLARILHAQSLTDGFHFVLVDCTDVRDFWETVLLSYVKSLLRPYQGETQVKKLLSFLFTDIAGSKVPPGFFDTMTGVPSRALQIYMTALLGTQQIKALVAKSSEVLGGSPIVRQIIRALCLLHSSDEDLHDLGYGWLLGQGLESSEAAELKLTNTGGMSYNHAEIVKGLSWLMAQRAPTLLVLDQLDPIIAQYHVAAAITEGRNDEQLRAKAIIEGLGGGLSKLYDNTCRTVSMIFALHNSWTILQATTLSSNLERFHPPLFLAPMNSSTSVTALLESRLRPAYQASGFTPSYPTYPFPEPSLTELGKHGLYPRQLLKQFAEHRERCLLQGSVQEFRLHADPVISPPPPSVDFSKMLAERAAQADVAKLLGEEQEDELGKRLASLCEALIYEIGTQPNVTFTCESDFQGGNYPSLHARLKRIDHGDQEREEHYCLRALQKSHHSAFRARLGAALTEAGIDQGLSFRRLVLFRNAKTIPGGVKTKEGYDKFIKAGGKVCLLSVKDLQIIEAVRTLLQEKALGFTTWLAQEKPLSQLPVVKEAFAGIFPQSGASPAAAPKEIPAPVSAPKPTVPSSQNKPLPSKTSPAKPAAPPEPKPSTPAPAPTLPLGHRILGSATQEAITLPAAALTKHAVNVRASTTKNHKQAILALHADLVSELRKLLAKLPPNENKLLAHLMPKMSVFKSDLKAAEIEFINAEGKRADFHSLRHTLATNLARAGTSPRIAMEVMRHSDIKLTTKTYTDAGLLPVADAVVKLPSLMRKARSTQIGTQNLFRAGHDQSTPGTDMSADDALQALGIKHLKQADSALVPTGQELANGSGGRARTKEKFERRGRLPHFYL